MSTLDVTDVPATLGFDAGSRQTGVALRVGNRCLNAGTFVPRTAGPMASPAEHDDRHRLVFNPPGRQTIIRSANAARIIEQYTARITAAGVWLLDVYGAAIGDEFYVAVEAVGGPSKNFAVAGLVAAELKGAFGGRYVVHTGGRSAGSLHQPGKGGSGRMLDAYPPMLVGKRGQWAEPVDGQKVPRLPHDGVRRNGKVVRRCDDEQAAYDVAAYLHVDAREGVAA